MDCFVWFLYATRLMSYLERRSQYYCKGSLNKIDFGFHLHRSDVWRRITILSRELRNPVECNTSRIYWKLTWLYSKVICLISFQVLSFIKYYVTIFFVRGISRSYKHRKSRISYLELQTIDAKSSIRNSHDHEEYIMLNLGWKLLVSFFIFKVIEGRSS